MVELYYTTYISVDLAHHDSFRAKGHKGGINHVQQRFNIIFAKDTQVH